LRFLDTNIFVRLISGDDSVKATACLALFQRLRDGSEEATTSESVLAEVVYVLSSSKLYRMPREDIRDGLGELLAIDGLRVAQADMCRRALDLFAGNADLDFEDALSVAHMEDRHIAELYSYDRDFDGVPGVTRIEP